MKRRLSVLLLALALPLIAVQADASPIAFSSSGLVPVNPLMVPGGSFSELGLSGMLDLDPSLPSSTQTINTAQLVVGSGAPWSVGGFDLSFLLTLGGITDTLTQHATWVSTPGCSGDSVSVHRRRHVWTADAPADEPLGTGSTLVT